MNITNQYCNIILTKKLHYIHTYFFTYLVYLKYLFSLPLLHVGGCPVQLPDLSQLLVDDPDNVYPELQEKEATVPTGCPYLSEKDQAKSDSLW